MENQPHSTAATPVSEAEKLIAHALKIIERHRTKGPGSPLKSSQVADLHYKMNCAKDKHDEGLKYKRLMEAAWQERDAFLGIKSNGGLMQCIEILTLALVENYLENKNELEQWGVGIYP